MIHYHGTPITPRHQLLRMGGRHFCVSFAEPRDLSVVLSIGQSVMFDNGAYSVWKRGAKLDVAAYYRWLEPVLVPPHWAVMPDVVDGSLEAQWKMRGTWPRESLGYRDCAPVWHLHLPLGELLYLVEAYPRVCIGSSGKFHTPGDAAWCARMDEVFNTLARQGRMPWIHGLRMMTQVDGGWPFASADSSNVAQTFKIRPPSSRKSSGPGCAECMAARVDVVQPAARWRIRELQQELKL